MVRGNVADCHRGGRQQRDFEVEGREKEVFVVPTPVILEDKTYYEGTAIGTILNIKPLSNGFR